ncbi:MAG: PfkB family carbohydrate kinase [Actinomycetota bacterium]
MNLAVVGHVEWVEFIRVEDMPVTGEIVHALEWWEEPGGGGAGAAGQLAKLAGSATFFTALGADDLATRTIDRLAAMGVTVHAAIREVPSRRAVTHVDAAGERTISVLGERLAPHGDDSLPWDVLGEADAVYFTAGDADALRRARSARVLVATARTLDVLASAGVQIDVLVGSAVDESELYEAGDIDPAPRVVVRTNGESGGAFETDDGRSGTYQAVSPHGPIVDRYGAGDCFAAGLTYALGRGDTLEGALDLAARCGAAVITGRGPYEGQLRPE